MTHAPLYWPTRIYIAMIHAENNRKAVASIGPANFRASSAAKPERWWVRLLRWIGQ